MRVNDLDAIFAKWTRLGALFGARPFPTTPDVEQLLIATARAIPSAARLHAMAVSWLVRYHRLVCRHRLAAMAWELEAPQVSAILGHVLASAKRAGRTRHFNLAIKACRPLETPIPLFDAYRDNPALAEVARSQTDAIGRTWGLWGKPERLYEDAIRPAPWVMSNNPSLTDRAMFSGGLAASVLVMLEQDADAGRSELALARSCRASRSSIRDALDHLELCQLIVRRRSGAALASRLAREAG
jgi:hypothetical protein